MRAREFLDVRTPPGEPFRAARGECGGLLGGLPHLPRRGDGDGLLRAEGILAGTLGEVELHLHDQQPEIQAAGEGIGTKGRGVERRNSVRLPEDGAPPHGRIRGLRPDLVRGVFQGAAQAFRRFVDAHPQLGGAHRLVSDLLLERRVARTGRSGAARGERAGGEERGAGQVQAGAESGHRASLSRSYFADIRSSAWPSPPGARRPTDTDVSGAPTIGAVE